MEMANQPLDPKIVEAVTEALANGEKIMAIKIYRDATGKGLRDAKEFIEQLTPRLLEQDPERFAKMAKSTSGCGAAALMFVATVCVLILFIG